MPMTMCGTGHSANKTARLSIRRYMHLFQDQQVPLEDCTTEWSHRASFSLCHEDLYSPFLVAKQKIKNNSSPVRSFAVFLGSFVVLCSPVWSFAVFSSTGRRIISTQEPISAFIFSSDYYRLEPSREQRLKPSVNSFRQSLHCSPTYQ